VVAPGGRRYLAAMTGIVASLAALAVTGGVGEAGTWLVLTRSYGCTDVKYLAETEKLPRVPTSPNEYADMMRARGHSVTVGLPTGASPALAGKAVMVTVNKDRRVFLQEELCEKPAAPEPRR
jgi:hypothetical protein